VIRIDGKPAVWVFLVERGLNDGSDLQLFWHEAAAIDAARAHLSASWPPEELATQADVLEAIEAANQLVGDEEYIVLAPFPIAGNQYFEGDTDDRPRCRACREPIELDDVDDPESWIHCEDANDLGDHTAER
jgi:hypothetical protein